MSLLGAVTLAEIRKLLSRPVARFGLVLFALLGVAGPALLWMLSSSSIDVNGGPLASTLDVSAPNGLRWSLVLRNFFSAQIFLAVLAAVSYAGEYQAHTLREDLVRPVPRAAVLLGKWIALGTFSFATLLIQAGAAAGVGLVLHPATSEGVSWSALGLGLVGTWAAEISVAAVALAVAVVLRSVAGTLAGLFLFLVFERFATWGLGGLRTVFSMNEAGQPPSFFEIVPFMPTSAWSGWSELASGVDPSWQPWVALVGWTVLAVVVAERTFSRTDVP